MYQWVVFFLGLIFSPCLSLPLRKACVTCGCSVVDHAPGNDQEDDQRMGRLLADSPYAHLTAKVKGGGGLRVYKRNRMIVTNPVVSRKDPTFNTTTYDWAPAGINQTLVRSFLRPNPLVGTEDAVELNDDQKYKLYTYFWFFFQCYFLHFNFSLYWKLIEQWPQSRGIIE